jgi:phage tail sheath gpL-like
VGINFETFPSNRRASIRAIEMAGKRRSVAGSYIPEKILIVGQYAAAKTGVTVGEKWQGFTADDFGDRYGFGSEIHRQAIKIFAALGGFSELVYGCPVAAPTGSPTAGTNTLTFIGDATTSGTMSFAIAGDLYQISVASGATAIQQAAALVAAITADINAAVTAAVGGTGSEHIVTLTSKTANVNANEIRVVQNPAGKTQIDATPSGTSVTISSEYLTGGSGNPVTTTVFTNGSSDNLGDTWFTLITCPYTDSTNLATYKAAGIARANPSVKRHFGYVAGYVKKTYSEAYAIPATINSKFCAPVWDTRPLCPAPEFAAAIVGTVAYLATLDPGRPFMDTELGIMTKQDLNLSYNELDALFRAGMGYCKLSSSGVLMTGDLALSYRTTAAGAATEEWFDLVSLTRRQEKVYSIDQLFSSAPYVRAIAGSNDLVTAKNYVIKPKTIVADLRNLVDFWASEGWTKNPDTVKASITAEINATYNGRMDATLTDDEALALRIVAIKYAFLY